MRNYFLTVMFLLLSGFCTFSQPSTNPVLVSTVWLAEHLDDDSLVILHAASLRADYLGGHIPGAKFLWNGWIAESTPEQSYSLPDTDILDTLFEGLGISDYSQIIIYHDLQDAAAAARAYITLEYLGFGNRTSILDGGLDAWKNEGRPVTKEIPFSKRGNITPRTRAGIFLNIDEVITAYNSMNTRLVDARSRLIYNGGGTGLVRPGHIKGAVNIPSATVLDSTGKYLPVDSLQNLFRQAEIKQGDEIITYCYSGRSACPLYIAAKLLGYPVHLYDGSYEEWSRRTDLPVDGANKKY